MTERTSHVDDFAQPRCWRTARAGCGLRFFIVSWLPFRFGEPIRIFIEKDLGLLFTLFMVLLVGGFVAVRYML